MLVRFPQQLTVTEHFQLGRTGEVVVSSGGRLPQPTAVATPGAAAQAVQAQNDLNQVTIDDATNAQNVDPIVFGRNGQPLSAENTLRGGDTVTGATGVLTYTWGGYATSPNAYRLRPIGALGGQAQFEIGNPRPEGPPAVGGQITVASANLLNFFNTFGNGCRRSGRASRWSAAGRTTRPSSTGRSPRPSPRSARWTPTSSATWRWRTTATAPTPPYACSSTASTRTTARAPGPSSRLPRRAPTRSGSGCSTSLPRCGPWGHRQRTPAATSGTGSRWRRPSGRSGTDEVFTVVVNHLKSKGSCPDFGARLRPGRRRRVLERPAHRAGRASRGLGRDRPDGLRRLRLPARRGLQLLRRGGPGQGARGRGLHRPGAALPR